VQTFLPFSDFKKSAECLDNKRLGKQRLECTQLLKVLECKKSNIKVGWMNHPAALMWCGYEEALKAYTNECLIAWINKGFKNTIQFFKVSEIIHPWWFGNEDFHRAMRSRLIVKKEEFYLPLFPEDKNFNNGKYFWPVNETKTFRII